MMSSRSNCTYHDFAPINIPIISSKSQCMNSAFNGDRSVFAEFTATMEEILAHNSDQVACSEGGDLQNNLDELTGQMEQLCSELCHRRATRRSHLKLKIDALLYLLPEDADTERDLLLSLIADLERNFTERRISRSSTSNMVAPTPRGG